MYDDNLRLAELEAVDFKPVKIKGVDLLIVMTRKSGSMTRKEKADAKLLNERSTTHLIDAYMAGRPP